MPAEIDDFSPQFCACVPRNDDQREALAPLHRQQIAPGFEASGIRVAKDNLGAVLHDDLACLGYVARTDNPVSAVNDTAECPYVFFGHRYEYNH